MKLSILDENDVVINVIEVLNENDINLPDGQSFGPVGGNIGETFDGTNYIAPSETPLTDSEIAANGLNATDNAMIRGVEDLVDVLIAKGTIVISDLPQALQDRISERENYRNDL